MNKVALCGYGTVGKGVKALLDTLPKDETQLVKVFDLPSKKEELGSLLVSDYHSITEDPEISTVIECLGGDELPYPLILESLKRGKAVISSNKETISRHLKEYLEAASLTKASLQFEASCGGGIPLLNPLYEISRFDEVLSLKGILNGTTNFILSKMGRDHRSFLSSLEEAQRLGFAEKDPTADLEGLDMVRKINILASLMYSYEIRNEDIPHFGIRKIDPSYFAYFEKKKEVLRFVADLHLKDGKLSLVVMPELFKKNDLLALVQEETNGVEVFTRHNGPLAFVGKGAGQEPTASAILQDYERILHHEEPHFPPTLTNITPTADWSGTYLGFQKLEAPQILLDPSYDDLKAFDFVVKEN
jgi:homoserine dehydrogenase